MNSSKLKDVDELLDDAKLRKTAPRVQILKALLDVAVPLTQEQIAEKIGKNSPDKVTIYRSLENFVEAGLVHKAYLQERVWHYELSHHCSSIQCHPHFTCTNCGATRCLWGKSPALVEGLEKGYVIHRQQVRLEGLCPKCS
ncbi:MAG: transcriptional repressor [Phycisphaerae bacterium]